MNYTSSSAPANWDQDTAIGGRALTDSSVGVSQPGYLRRPTANDPFTPSAASTPNSKSPDPTWSVEPARCMDATTPSQTELCDNSRHGAHAAVQLSSLANVAPFNSAVLLLATIGPLMENGEILLDEVVYTDYNHFDVVWECGGGFNGDWKLFYGRQTNGLLGVSDSRGFHVWLARRSGGSPIRIERLVNEPELDDAWEDVVEGSIEVPRTPTGVTWLSDLGMRSGPLDIPPGCYRVRVSATGRDRAEGHEFDEEVLDRYLIQLWPEPVKRPDLIVRTTTENARRAHDTRRLSS